MVDETSIEIEFEPEPVQAGLARRHVSRICRGLDRDVVATAQLLTTEVVSNAIQHGRTKVTLRVVRKPQELLVAVLDGNPAVPSRVRKPTGESGRGLLILERLAFAWGVERLPGRGKCVWFQLRTAHAPHPRT